MGTFRRWTRAGRRLLRGPTADDPAAPEAGQPGEDPGRGSGEQRTLAGWLEQRAERVVERVYRARVEELEERARRAMSSAYERSADDLEERAVRAMRRALEAEADRIRSAIEHGIQVKRREVRLSLAVLVVAALVYLVLHWLTTGGGPT
jgi:hypothetical protein